MHRYQNNGADVLLSYLRYVFGLDLTYYQFIFVSCHDSEYYACHFSRLKNSSIFSKIKSEIVRALRMNLDELLYENVDLSTDDGVNAVREKIQSLNVSQKQIYICL